MKPLQISLFFCLLLQLSLPHVLPAQPAADPRARALAEQVLERMGGTEGWEATHFIAWAFNGQYQVWDKQKNQFRWEKDSVVVVVDTHARTGKAYVRGQALQDQAKVLQLLEHAHAQWLTNSFWLLMPFRLLDADILLRYSGEGQTQAGAAADVLELSFVKERQGRYLVWVDKEEGLITQWSFYSTSTATEPVFIRKWADYNDYGTIKLAADRSSLQSDLRLHRIAVPAYVPDEVFNSPLPLAKRKGLGL